MKKVIAIFFVCLFFVLSLFLVREFRQRIDRFIALTPDQTTFKEPSPTPTSPEAKQIDQTLFVPYWSLTSSSPLPAYQTLIYFSVLATNQGIDTTESGYTHLEQFANLSAGQQKLLTVSMQNSSTNFVILKDQASQKKVIDQSIALAKKYGFKGILLNIEVSALPFSSLIEQITDFNKSYATAVHRAGLSYSITAYGDTFYRLRPFDMKTLAENSDTVYIMAYDFSKASGNPGPNFPLHGSSTYGYDYEQMLNNFADNVPLRKLTVVFGMYGYDWPVDSKGQATDTGTSVALKDIEAKLITSCEHLSCRWERDTLSGETKAVYQDSDTDKHIVWFEDEESVKSKQAYLKSHGVGSFAYWAYSYF